MEKEVNNAMVLVSSEFTMFADPACIVWATDISELSPALDIYIEWRLELFFFAIENVWLNLIRDPLLTILEDGVEAIQEVVGEGPIPVSQLSFQHSCQPNKQNIERMKLHQVC